MGNIIPALGAENKQIIEDLAKDFLGSFSVEFVQAYGVEYARSKLAEMEKEAFKEDKPKRELMYREDATNDEPIKKGYLIKQGAVVKNWKKRYFIVKQDNSIEYYENQEAFEKGFKHKGVIYPAGYEVEEDADSVIVERLKKVAKQLGVDEKDISFPEKYPDHTFELGHKQRRSYYITAENEEEKKEWIEVMKTCCKRFKGFRNPDPVSRVAFKKAYVRACSTHSFYCYSEYHGTEEQVLTYSIAQEIDYRVMGDVYSNLSNMAGGYKVRKRVREQVLKTLDSLVTAMVIPSYKGQVETTQKMIGPLDDLIKDKKDDIIEMQKTLNQKLSDALDENFVKAFDGVKDAVIEMESAFNEVAIKMISPAREHLLVNIIDDIIEKAKDNDDIEASLDEYFKKLCTSRSWRCKSKWYEFYNIAQLMLPVVRKHNETFGDYNPYDAVYTALDMMAQVLDAAGYTFQELFKDVSKGTDALKNGKTAAEVMITSKDQILPKFDADAHAVAKEISFHLTHEIVMSCLKSKLESVAKELIGTLNSTVPDPINKIVSVKDRYDNYVYQMTKKLTKKVLGMEDSAETPKENPEKTAQDKESAEKTAEDKESAEKTAEDKESEPTAEEKAIEAKKPAEDEKSAEPPEEKEEKIVENPPTDDEPTTEL